MVQLYCQYDNCFHGNWNAINNAGHFSIILHKYYSILGSRCLWLVIYTSYIYVPAVIPQLSKTHKKCRLPLCSWQMAIDAQNVQLQVGKIVRCQIYTWWFRVNYKLKRCQRLVKVVGAGEKGVAKSHELKRCQKNPLISNFKTKMSMKLQAYQRHLKWCFVVWAPHVTCQSVSSNE